MNVVMDNQTGRWLVPSFSRTITYRAGHMLDILHRHRRADDVPVKLLVQVLSEGSEMEARLAAGHPRCPSGPRLQWFWKNIKKELDSKRKDAMVSRFIEACKKKREERKIG